VKNAFHSSALRADAYVRGETILMTSRSTRSWPMMAGQKRDKNGFTALRVLCLARCCFDATSTAGNRDVAISNLPAVVSQTSCFPFLKQKRGFEPHCECLIFYQNKSPTCSNVLPARLSLPKPVICQSGDGKWSNISDYQNKVYDQWSESRKRWVV